MKWIPIFILSIILSVPAHAQTANVIFSCPYYPAQAVTTLSAAIDNSQTTVTTVLMNTFWPPFVSFPVFVGTEEMLVTARTDTTISTLTVTRGFNSTTAAAHAQGATMRLTCGTITGIQATNPVNNVGQQGHLLMVNAPTAVADVNNIQIRLEASADCGDPPPTGTCATGHWFPISEDITKLTYTTATTPPQAYAIVKADGTFPYVRVNNLLATPGSIPIGVQYSGAPFPFGNVSLVCTGPLSCIFIINPGGGGGPRNVTFVISGSSSPGTTTGSGTINFSSINDGACADGTFTLTGCVNGATIAPQWPFTVTAASGMFGQMACSAADTVQVRECNLSGAAVDLASATFGAAMITASGSGTVATGDPGLYPSIEGAGWAITSCTISANASCSASVSVRKKNAAIPGGGDAISGTGPVTLSSSQLNQAACDLTKWTTTSVSPNDVFSVNVDSVSGCGTIMVQIWGQ